MKKKIVLKNNGYIRNYSASNRAPYKKLMRIVSIKLAVVVVWNIKFKNLCNLYECGYRLNYVKWEILKIKKNITASKADIHFCKKFAGFCKNKS